MDYSSIRAICKSCGHTAVLGWDDVKRAAGDHLSNVSAINDNVLSKLANRLRCTNCNAKNVKFLIEGTDGRVTVLDSPQRRLCVDCKKPISSKRLELAPRARRCVRCERRIRGGDEKDGIYYCRICGAPMVWRVPRPPNRAEKFLGCSNYPKCRYTMSEMKKKPR